LEVNGSMLDLYDNIVVKFIVKTVKEFDSSIGAIGFPVALVESQMVVDEGSEEDSAVVRS
jgi:hypothetical protein